MKLALISLLFTLASCGQPSDESPLNSDPLQSRFPQTPEPSMTPGQKCQNPDRTRYPERIKYCERNVSTSFKYQIIADYDRDFGYQIGRTPRSQFKIDHYISLCMGGSNDRKNLWPQHQSVYVLTDPLEGKLCRLLSRGSMTQAKAIEKLIYAKNHLDEAREIEIEIDEQLNN